MFAATVVGLGIGLRREGGSMQLQVKLARPHRGVRVFRLCGSEERVGISYDDAGRSFEVPQPPSPFQHLAGWATATVAVSEGQQGSGSATLVGKVSNR